jgi:hypothetical protein
MTTKLRFEGEKTLERLLLDIFGGNPYYAQARNVNGDISYGPIENPLSEEIIRLHLRGDVTLGSYHLIQGANVVRWLGWDVDSKDLKEARSVAEKIIKHLINIPYAVEFSGRKGYHILIFLKEPMLAGDALRVTQWVREAEGLKSTGDTHVECFPKQDKLSKTRPKGNLLKIPLGEHPLTHDRSRFVEPNNGWENGPEIDQAEILSYRASTEEVMAIMDEGPDIEAQIVEIISDYWTPGKRHDLSLYLCGYLAHEGWGLEQSKDLMRKIVARTGDDEEYNRIQTVHTTYTRHKEGKGVRGRQGLGDILPVSVMQMLTELVAKLRAPDSVAQIDDIRYIKGKPKIEQARLASNTMWSILNDDGNRIFQTDQNIAYWYNQQDHTVVRDGTETWEAMMNQRFGLNSVDTFSRLVNVEFRLRTVREAPIVPIHHRTYWAEDLGKLFVNLGGPEVYIVSGEGQIEKSYNGECGYMFLTNDSGKFITPDFTERGIDAWDHLVNDLSFTTSPEAPATPEEQRELLKAWILCFFFNELMPTKPILAVLGVPGSGKTTAIRRILRILEDPNADVLGVPTDKQDAFRASIESHRLLVMDNLEKSGAYWMVDILNKLSTGNQIEIRQLYKTNAKYTIIPKCYVACTAVNMPFSDETLFSRLLVLEMTKLNEPMPEHILQKRIKEYGPGIWADLLRKLGKVVDIIKSGRVVRPPTKSRLVDFNVFCERIKDCDVVDGRTLSMGLLSMVDSQLRQLKESSQAIYLLEEWISLKPQEAAEWKNITQIYEILYMMAQARKVNFSWKTANALHRHFATLEDRLKNDFGAEIRSEYSQSARREVVRMRFNSQTI